MTTNKHNNSSLPRSNARSQGATGSSPQPSKPTKPNKVGPYILETLEPGFQRYVEQHRNVAGVKYQSIFTTKDGHTYYGHNHMQDFDPPLSDIKAQENHLKGCAEMDAMAKAQAAGEPIDGGSMVTVRTRNNTGPNAKTDDHGTLADPCQPCQRVLTTLGTTFRTKGSA